MYVQRKQAKINQLQKRVSEIAEDLSSNPKLFYEVSRYSNPVGYFISPELGTILFDYLEELEMIQDKELVKSVEDSKQEIELGNGQDLEDVLSKLN